MTTDVRRCDGNVRGRRCRRDPANMLTHDGHLVCWNHEYGTHLGIPPYHVDYVRRYHPDAWFLIEIADKLVSILGAGATSPASVRSEAYRIVHEERLL